MVRKRLIVATILAIAPVAVASTTPVNGALDSPPQPRPLIVSAELRGNNLIVEGANFDENATVYINYKKRETILDAESQGKVLMVRKGGKRIRFDDYSTVTFQMEMGKIPMVSVCSGLMHLWRGQFSSPCSPN